MKYNYEFTRKCLDEYRVNHYEVNLRFKPVITVSSKTERIHSPRMEWKIKSELYKPKDNKNIPRYRLSY